MTTLSGYYQLPDDAAAAGQTRVDTTLVNYLDGQLLYASGTDVPLTANLDTLVVSSGTAYPGAFPEVVSSITPVQQGNENASEISFSLLGVPKVERKLGLFAVVNTYGVNPQYWHGNISPSDEYTYWEDPVEYTFDGDFGYYEREIKTESSLQAYVYPPARSFAFPVDDGTGRFPGDYTDGRMRQYWQSKQAFRYQPGRITGVTMGVRMSTNSQHTGEVISWGVRNPVGDGYYFQLERGTDLYIVRTSPDLGTLKIARDDWNGDPVTIGPESRTQWNLDLTKVTMFGVEFGWYGAIGARFYAYVPIGYRDSRWVLLHSITASDEYAVPSLRSPFMNMFVEAVSTAGTTQPAFINLYGSSVYIDGGDDGTLTTGSATLDTPKLIDSTDRTILGLQLKPRINGVTNLQKLYPISLGLRSDVDAKVTASLQYYGLDLNYTPGFGTNLSRGPSAAIPVTKLSDVVLSGSFPNISGEYIQSANYLDGRPVKVVGNGIYSTHVINVNEDLTQITVDRELPASVTSIRLARFDAWAVSSGIIPSGVDKGSVYFRTGGGYWRLGLIPQSVSGTWDSDTEQVCWFASKYPALDYNSKGLIKGESAYPFEPYWRADFVVATGSTNTTLTAGPTSITISGLDPYPLRIVAELQDDASITDVVYTTDTVANIPIPGSGTTNAVTVWTASGVTQSSTTAGGITYVAAEFKDSPHSSVSAAVVDQKGYKVLSSPNRLGTYFIQSGEAVQYDLNPLFGQGKMFVGGRPGTVETTGALYITASARNGSGYITATLDWEEQQ
jgi:hypothetical protein